MRHIWLPLILFLAGCPSDNPQPETVVPIADPVDKSCAPIRDVLRILSDHYGERPVGQGEVKDSAFVLMIGPQSWTVLSVKHGGIACLVVAGTPLSVEKENE